MTNGDFWVVVGSWYLVLGGILAAAFHRFGAESMLHTLANPSAKVVGFLALFLLPIPVIFQRMRRS